MERSSAPSTARAVAQFALTGLVVLVVFLIGSVLVFRVAFTGRRKTVVITLKKGTYRFFCAPHADDMHGGFTVA